MAHATDLRRPRPQMTGAHEFDASWPALHGRLTLGYLRMLGLVALIAAIYVLRIRYHSNDDAMFTTQDLPALPLLALGLIALRWTPGRLADVRRAVSPRTLALLAALAVVVVATAGAPLLFGAYHPSLDEFLADSDALIFAHGQAAAPVAPAWRPFVGAMQPILGLPVPGHVAWASNYLPVNALVRAAALKLGALPLANPLWSGLGVLATFGVGRRLWPQRPWMAAAAAALLATSSQLLVMGMTGWAMPAHLALDMLWLMLFLRGGRLGHAGALVTAFAACGLHEFVFHPLFAAPFVLQLWLDRRWRLAALYTLAYAAICLFWVFYWQLLFRLLGLPAHASVAVGGQFFLWRIGRMVGDLSPLALGPMAEALVRFCAWQNLIVVPLALAGGASALRAGGPLRALALGVVLTLAAMLLMMPAQTIGWGYRYLHGFLGSISLLAVYGWDEASRRFAPADRSRGEAALAGACALSLAVVLPLHAWQAWRFTQPLAAAYAKVSQAPADVVLVDNSRIYFDAGYVVRNDPYLRNRPKIMLLSQLGADGLRAVCGRYSVLNFDGRDAAALGVPTMALPPTASMDALRALRARLGCDRRLR